MDIYKCPKKIFFENLFKKKLHFLHSFKIIQKAPKIRQQYILTDISNNHI